jgi:putative tricarboxylic transport membrane protein
MDRIGAVAMLLFGLVWVWVGSGYSMTSRDGGPGAGVLPTALGAIIAALALASFFRPEVDRIELPQLSRILIILGALAGYALLLNPLGYVISTALLLGVLLMAFAERKHWWQPVAAIGVSFATYAIFRLLLSVPLPPDPLELVR